MQIDSEHREYNQQKHVWAKYRDLYAGGQQFKCRASNYLLRRQKEPLDVYGERLNRTFYENHIGSIIDWYAATLFRRAPSLQYSGGSLSGQDFLAELSEDCNRAGSSLADFFQRCFRDAMVTGCSYLLVDFPEAPEAPANRAEEDAAGLSRGFLVNYQVEDLINWSLDENDQFEWVVLRTTVEKQAGPGSPDRFTETLWRYFDKTRFKVFRRTARVENSPIELVAEGLHALAPQSRVPLFALRVTEGLWLMNKAADLQLEHFNKANALGWATTMGLFAMPVIYSDREWNQIVGESYYIQLAPGDRFGWTEPDGKVYQVAATNLQTLKEEIYRVCYLSQASGETLTGQAQSAISKQLDFLITQDVLRAYGALIKSCMKSVLKEIVAARQDDLRISVSGLDEFDISDFATELQQATGLLALGIQSSTLKKQVFERLVMKYLGDARQETKDQIAREIEANT